MPAEQEKQSEPHTPRTNGACAVPTATGYRTTNLTNYTNAFALVYVQKRAALIRVIRVIRGSTPHAFAVHCFSVMYFQ